MDDDDDDDDDDNDDNDDNVRRTSKIETKNSFRQQEQEQRQRVQGILLSGITPTELKIFDWFEDDDYERCSAPVSLRSKNGDKNKNTNKNKSDDDDGYHDGDDDDYDYVGVVVVNANVYIWSAGEQLLDLESSWSFDEFCTHKLDWYLESTVHPCKEEYDTTI